MKTPTVDDPKPKRDNLGPTGPAKVSNEDEGKGEESGSADPPPADVSSYEHELEHILDKRPQTTSG